MQIRTLVAAGILTWVIVALPHVRDIQWLWAVCYVAFIVLFLWATRDQCPGALEIALTAVQAVLALICCALEPNGMQPVLLVIVAAQLGHLRPRMAIGWIIVQSIALGFIATRVSDSPRIAL